MPDIKVSVLNNCARCGNDHTYMDFMELERAVLVDGESPTVMTHWAECPHNGQPILLVATATA